MVRVQRANAVKAKGQPHLALPADAEDFVLDAPDLVFGRPDKLPSITWIGVSYGAPGSGVSNSKADSTVAGGLRE